MSWRGIWPVPAITVLLLGVASPAEGQYVDTQSSCLQCHEAGLRQNDFCAAVSGEVWLQDDKHRRAFYLLHESDPADAERGAAKRALVRQILGFELADAFTDGRFLRLKNDADAQTVRKVAVVKSCLRCHATWPTAADAEFAHEAPVPLDLGVSCQACHGPGEKWDAPHRLMAWRVVTPEAKAALGFFDCRSSAAKARLCLSCHVGSIEEGKFVKHEWYAAGHPPLPGFELASFQSQMPRHWKSLAEKGDFAFRARPPGDDSGQLARQFEALERSGVRAEAIKSSYLEANFPEAMSRGVDPGTDLAATKDAVVGGAVLLEAYARMLGTYAAAAAGGNAAWPELALYDCAACHHELRGGLAQARPARRSAPGRPPMPAWTNALAAVAVNQARNGLDIELMAADLERALTVRPFGDAGQVALAADALARALTGLSSESAATAFGAPAARQALVTLTSDQGAGSVDFATARQMAWAIRAIAADLDNPAGRRLFEADGSDPLALALPSGPQRSVMENQARWLTAAARFDPVWFSAELKAAREMVGP